jgi:hypothetical protein
MTLIERSTRLFVTAGLLAASAPLAAQRGPSPVMTHLSAEVIALACAPTLVFETPSPSLLITGGQESFTHHSFGPGDLITINGGTDNGIEVGQEFFVRRVQMARDSRVSRANPASVRTAGWVRVYAVDKTMSLVTVTNACDTLNVGDYLEPYVEPQVPVADANPPKPQRENYGHIMLGTDRRTVFARDDFFVIDRGTDHGVTIGERVIIYRDKRKVEAANKSSENRLPKGIVPEFLYELGEAVVVTVTPEMSTLKVTLARDAMMTGDYVALRK